MKRRCPVCSYEGNDDTCPHDGSRTVTERELMIVGDTLDSQPGGKVAWGATNQSALWAQCA